VTLTPDYKITIGSVSLDPSSTDEHEGLNIQLGIQVPANSFQIVLRPTSATSGIKVGDPVAVSLGYDSKLTKVFAGAVNAIELGTSRLVVHCLSEMFKLLNLKTNQTYLSQNAGQITKDLCSKAQVSTGDIQDGVSLPSFFVSHDVPAYEYVKELAERSDFDVYMSPDSKLNSKAFNPSVTHTLEYGLDVLRVEASQVRPPEAVKVFGESPSSMKGSSTSHWLSKDNIEGSAGSGQQLVFSDPAVKDKSTANSVAKSRLSRASETFHVRVTTLGNPTIKLGDGVSLKRFVNTSLKGNFKVFAVDHSLRNETGFLTKVDCSRSV